MPTRTDDQLEREISRAVAAPARRGRRRKARSAHEVRKERLEALRAIMVDALGDGGWREADPWEIDKWISVDDALPDRQWFREAQDQLIESSVLPEHAGAPPENVRAWNDVFISTYRMNLDDGMGHEDAVDSARQNASDTVRLRPGEHELVRDDPALYRP